MKVGDEYFQAYADAEEGTVQIWHWIITSIRQGTVYATQKTDYTWVKRSRTNGDYGWAKNISDWNKRRFREADGAPKEWARSKAAAYGNALGPVEAALKKLTKIRAQLTGQRTKARARANPAKSGASSPAAGRAGNLPPAEPSISSPTQPVPAAKSESHNHSEKGT